jgi:predicted N-acetyltransferase YhbS
VSGVQLVRATGDVLDRILDESFAQWGDGLSRAAYARFNAAQMRTSWGAAHLRRLALVDGGRLLSSAKQYEFEARLDGRRVGVLGIGAVFTPPSGRGRGHARVLIERMLADAAGRGVELALLFSEIGAGYYERLGFRVVPTSDTVLDVTRKPGAPAMLVRAGEEGDYAAIADAHAARAAGYRFSLIRSSDYVAYAVAKKRLLAGLGPDGQRAVQFFVAEEGGRAVAYVVMTVTGRRATRDRPVPVGDAWVAPAERWAIEEWGDRDPTGARLGAMLQVLLARMPGEAHPVIRTWLPAGFRPPQVASTSRQPANTAMMIRWTDDRPGQPALGAEEVFYLRGDAF